LIAGYRSPLRDDANAGRVAVVTGCGTGIGRATALELAECLAVPADLIEPEGVSSVVHGGADAWGIAAPPPERERR
jgi:NAD(P)-dependent dehydrogenase (short-subunit alcohol dehydrogenase family)